MLILRIMLIGLFVFPSFSAPTLAQTSADSCQVSPPNQIGMMQAQVSAIATQTPRDCATDLTTNDQKVLREFKKELNALTSLNARTLTREEAEGKLTVIAEKYTSRLSSAGVASAMIEAGKFRSEVLLRPLLRDKAFQKSTKYFLNAVETHLKHRDRWYAPKLYGLELDDKKLEYGAAHLIQAIESNAQLSDEHKKELKKAILAIQSAVYANTSAAAQQAAKNAANGEAIATATAYGIAGAESIVAGGYILGRTGGKSPLWNALAGSLFGAGYTLVTDVSLAVGDAFMDRSNDGFLCQLSEKIANMKKDEVENVVKSAILGAAIGFAPGTTVKQIAAGGIVTVGVAGSVINAKESYDKGDAAGFNKAVLRGGVTVAGVASGAKSIWEVLTSKYAVSHQEFSGVTLPKRMQSAMSNSDPSDPVFNQLINELSVRKLATGSGPIPVTTASGKTVNIKSPADIKALNEPIASVKFNRDEIGRFQKAEKILARELTPLERFSILLAHYQESAGARRIPDKAKFLRPLFNDTVTRALMKNNITGRGWEGSSREYDEYVGRQAEKTAQEKYFRELNRAKFLGKTPPPPPRKTYEEPSLREFEERQR